MKQSFDSIKAQENMQAGVITATGFLGRDKRPITDIIEADEEVMTKLGLDWDQSFLLLKQLLEAGKAGLSVAITVDNKWLVKVDETRGTLPSPWEDGIFHKVNCEVERIGTGLHLLYNELSLHMFEKYHFLQGRGSIFRINPQDIKEVLY